jgi:hypothetical protein
VYPYHASGMALDLTKASRTSADPLTYTWFPVDKTKGGYDNNAECGVEGTTCGNNGPTYDDVSTYSNRDDLFFAYQFHPGRGGIVGTSNTIDSTLPHYDGTVTAQVGSFNTLFPFMTPNLSNTPKYYQKGGAASGTNNAQKNAYDDAGLDGNHGSLNFGTAGSATPLATPNSYYKDVYGTEWDFSIVHNVPYSDYMISPNPNSDAYWSSVPKFNDITFPTVNDEVRLLKIDCAVPVVEAWSKLSDDYHANDSITIQLPPSTGDLQITSPGTTVDMTWDGTKWSGTPTTCSNTDTFTVTSGISGGGSASYTKP